jgi:hypothetical protein
VLLEGYVGGFEMEALEGEIRHFDLGTLKVCDPS